MRKIFLYLFWFFISFHLINTKAQIAGGTYTIKSGGNYSTLTDAINALNTNGLTATDDGPVIFLIGENQTVTESGGFGWKINSILNSSSINQVIFRPETSTDPILTINLSSVNKTGWGFNGSNYITIDGWDQSGVINRDLTVQIASFDGATIELIDANPGCNYFTIKNTNIYGNSINTETINSCVLIKGSYHNNITLQNNYFSRSSEGIDCIGSIGGSNNNNLIIDNNVFGSTSIDNNRLSNYGINIGQYHNVRITNNEIRNMCSVTSGNQVIGINISIIDSLICSSNHIHDFSNTGDAIGINQTTFMTAFNLKNYEISNNIIEYISSSLDNKQVYGIYSSTNQVKGKYSNNIIRELQTQSSNANATGIYATGIQNTNITANNISRIYNINTANNSRGGRGIYLTGTINTDTIANNFISAIGGGSSTNWSETDFNDFYPYGLFINTTEISNLKIYFNSIYLTPAAKSESSQTAYGVNTNTSYSGGIGIKTDNGRDIDLRNNIIYNVLTGDTLTSAPYQFPIMVFNDTNPFDTCNYNVYKMGRWPFAELCNSFDWVALVNNSGKSLIEWQTFTTEDGNSVSQNATISCSSGYATNSNVFTSIGDLHLLPGTSIEGTNVGINSDFDGDIRTSPYSIGGDQGSENLPVELLSFSAHTNSRNLVEVNWTTSTEINNHIFIVERSQNSTTFDSVTFANGAGNSNTIINYQITDNAPFEGISYYRLRQIDYDGLTYFSNICPVLINGIEIINIFPQPAKNDVTFQIVCAENITAKISIFDDIGRTIFLETFIFQSGLNSISIPVLHYAKGIYLFNISTSDLKTKTSKNFIVGSN